MDVRNFTQFANLISMKQAIHVHPSFDRLVICMMTYNNMCACGGSTTVEKHNKHSECNRIYRESLGIVDSIKAHLFEGCADNTISFYIDDVHHLKTLTR